VATAQALGAELGRRGYGLVYGGGQIGLMGELADAAMAAGSEVTGVIPRALDRREVAHRGIDKLLVVDSMHERKATMAEEADAFIALPGGLGTLEELFEVLTWAQLGIHHKPCGLLDVAGFYRSLLDFLDGQVSAGFLSPVHRGLLHVAVEPAELLDRLEAFEPPELLRWLDPEQS
jgi:uncharacterized protein (TIGR00730 family)